jgi:hypothetical protein
MSEVFEIPEGTLPESIVPSPDATQAAYVVREKWGMHVEVSGRAHRHYDAVAGLTFSPDSKGVAYAATREEAWFVVFGEKEFGPYADIGKTSPVVSPDSKHVAYAALHGRGGWLAVLDGTIIGGPYEGFSPGGLLFSPDSRRLAYVVKKVNVWTVVVNGQEQKSHLSVLERSLAFSPDSKRLAYIACAAKSGFFRRSRMVAMLVVDDKLGPAWLHDESSGRNGFSNEIVFSPDSQRIAYAVAQNGRWTWVVDDMVQGKVDGFVSGWGGNPEWARFPDHGKTCCRKQTLSFSPDSRHFAYAGGVGGEHILFYDGEARGRHQGILNWPLTFSPDSAQLAYGAEENGRQFIVLNWKPLGRHYGVCSDRTFSLDSTQFAYVAMETPESFQLVVGPRSWQMPGGPVIGSRLVWDDADNLHALMAKGRRITVVRYRTR